MIPLALFSQQFLLLMLYAFNSMIPGWGGMDACLLNGMTMNEGYGAAYRREAQTQTT
jgi:hypothetical protein